MNLQKLMMMNQEEILMSRVSTTKVLSQFEKGTGYSEKFGKVMKDL